MVGVFLDSFPLTEKDILGKPPKFEDLRIFSRLGPFGPGAVCVGSTARHKAAKICRAGMGLKKGVRSLPIPKTARCLAQQRKALLRKTGKFATVRSFLLRLRKFLLGQKPMSEWDNFVAGLDDMQVDELLQIWDEAYSAAMSK